MKRRHKLLLALVVWPTFLWWLSTQWSGVCNQAQLDYDRRWEETHPAEREYLAWWDIHILGIK